MCASFLCAVIVGVSQARDMHVLCFRFAFASALASNPACRARCIFVFESGLVMRARRFVSQASTCRSSSTDIAQVILAHGSPHTQMFRPGIAAVPAACRVPHSYVKHLACACVAVACISCCLFGFVVVCARTPVYACSATEHVFCVYT